MPTSLPQRAWEVRATLDHPLFGTGLVKLDARLRPHQPAPGPHPDRRRVRRAGQHRHRQARSSSRSPSMPRSTASGSRAGASSSTASSSGPASRTRSRATRAASPASIPIGSGAPNSAATSASSLMARRSATATASASSAPTKSTPITMAGSYGTAFVEYRPSERTTVTFDVDNLFNTKGLRNRLFSFPNRSQSHPLAQRIPRTQQPRRVSC